MKPSSASFAILSLVIAGFTANAQKLKDPEVPGQVKVALKKTYPLAKNVHWEKEDGNFEANWGGKSGEDVSVAFSSAGEFLEVVNAISISQLPKPIPVYIQQHYKGVAITEAGRVTNGKGKITYEAEVDKKDLTFDEKGNFIKAGK